MKKKILFAVALGAIAAGTFLIFASGVFAQRPGGQNDSRPGMSPNGGQPGGAPAGSQQPGGAQPNGQQPGGPLGGNNEEAAAACEDKSEGDTCSFEMTLPGKDGADGETKEVEGTCQKRMVGKDGSSEEDDTLVCRPKMAENGVLTRARQMEQERTREISRIKLRTEKLIAFLEDQDVDEDTLDTIEGYYDDFKSKAETLSDKLGALADLSDSDDRKEALDEVKTAAQNMKESFSTLRSAIKDALDDLKNED